MRKTYLLIKKMLFAVFAALLMTGCAALLDAPAPKPEPPKDSIFGPGGLRFKDGKAIIGTPSLKRAETEVNLWLWRAALEMGDRFGIHQADPWGGTVLTDWMQHDAEANGRRLRMQAVIMGPELIAENLAVHIIVERQPLRNMNTDTSLWVREPLNLAVQQHVKLSLLTRAHALREEFERNK